MRISRKKGKRAQQKQDAAKQYRLNNRIRVPELRVIDENGDNVGVISTQDALALAQEKGLDLVEVSPMAQPPVAKILDFNKLKYQEEKDRRKERASQKKVETKGIRLSFRISDHDAQVRMKQAEKFLGQDHKVKIEMILRGRERRHMDMAKENITKFIDEINQHTPVFVEQAIGAQGGKLSVLIAKKPS